MPFHPDVNSRYYALDGWRGIAALFVALLHFRFVSHISTLPIVQHAGLFVDFFFVLSGFVISHATDGRLNNGADLARFAGRRFARLWPLHVVALSLIVAFQILAYASDRAGFVHLPQPAFTERYALEAIPTNLTFLQTFGMHQDLTWNLPSWSIAVEFWVYVGFGCLLVLTKRTTVISIAIIAIAVLVLLRFSASGMLVGNSWGIFRCLAGFFSGHIVYLMHRRLRIGRAAFGAQIFFGAGALLFIWFTGETWQSLLAPAVFGALIMSFASTGMCSTAMTSRPLRTLGDLSFSIYIIHYFIHLCLFQGVRVAGQMLHMRTIIQVDGQDVVNLGKWQGDIFSLVYLAIVIGSAFLLRKYIELPCQVWAKRRLAGDQMVAEGKDYGSFVTMKLSTTMLTAADPRPIKPT